MSTPIYLDYNATTPLEPRVLDAMLPYLSERFGNPSSNHAFGVEGRRAVDEARTQVAGLLGCRPEEIVFTSGGTESNNLAIAGIARARRHAGNHIVTSQIEHPAVEAVCRFLEGDGFRISRIPVNGQGEIDVDALDATLCEATILITVMHANNEVGTVQPIADITEIARRRGVLVHSDAAQSVAKIPTDVDALGVDLLTVAGHKIYAPKGIGALYIRDGVRIDKLLHGADHERGLRPGTENVASIVGLGAACNLAARDAATTTAHLKATRDALFEGLRASCPGVSLNGHPERRLPNTLSLSFAGFAASAILAAAGGIAASAGAACHSDRVSVSQTLAAMGLSEERALGTIRLSTGRMTTLDEVRRATDIIADAVARLT